MRKHWALRRCHTGGLDGRQNGWCFWRPFGRPSKTPTVRTAFWTLAVRTSGRPFGRPSRPPVWPVLYQGHKTLLHRPKDGLKLRNKSNHTKQCFATRRIIVPHKQAIKQSGKTE